MHICSVGAPPFQLTYLLYIHISHQLAFLSPDNLITKVLESMEMCWTVCINKSR